MARNPDEILSAEVAPGARQRLLSFAAAIAFHALVLWGLASALSFQTLVTPERLSEPRIVALAPRDDPPPPDIEETGEVDAVTILPRFRPRAAAPARERREGDPALAIWTYLCNRDETLSEAVRRACPEFQFGDVMFGSRDPLNRRGDVGALLGPDTTTMSLDEIGKAKGWFKPKSPLPADGARAKPDDLGLPGHDPFAILPGHNRSK